MRLPTSRAFVGGLALILTAHFHGSIARRAQVQSILLDQPLRDGRGLHSSITASGLVTDGSTADSAGLPNGPSVDGDSTSKQRSAPYDSLRLLPPNFDADEGSTSNGSELSVNGIDLGAAVERVYHTPIRKQSLQRG